MSAPLEALLRAALARTGIEAFVWDFAADTVQRMRAGHAPHTMAHTRADVLRAIEPEDRGAFEAALQRSIQARSPLEHEYRTGGRWMRIEGSFQADLLIGTIVEITAEKNRRSAYEHLIDNIPYFIARVDLDGRYLYVNRGAENNPLGLPRAAFIGKTAEEMGIGPAAARTVREAEARLITTGEPQRVELTEVPILPGRTLNILLVPERDESGHLTSILRVTRDITRAKQSEERLQLATRASLAMIYDWNMVTNVTYRSDAVRELTGFSPEETQRSEWWISDIHPEDRERAESRVREAIDKGEDRYENEYRLRHRDGSWRWVWDRGFILRDEAGHAVRAVGSTVDVTARRLAEEELKAAHRAKDDFLATLSHELRTPMTAILGWTSMLSNDLVDAQTLPLALGWIHDSARTQAQLIEDLLDISRIATGKLSIEKGQVDLVSVIATSVDSFRVAAVARSIDLRTSVDATDLLILGDEKRMRQIVANLISNALKFTPAGGRVDVTLTCDDHDAVVVVRDTGMGIEPEFLPHVFDRFSQQERGDSRMHGGLGLGLAIVNELVDLHGGSVIAESAGAGCGATFTVTIPRVRAPFRPTAQPAPSTRPLPRLDGVRVLLVEDEPHARRYMESVLASSGADVRAAASAAEALIAEDDLSVIVSDIAMPGEDGLSLIAKLRTRDAAAGRRTPALAVTALGFGDDRRRILSAGFDEYLAKPVDPLVLLETVAALVGKFGVTS